MAKEKKSPLFKRLKVWLQLFIFSKKKVKNVDFVRYTSKNVFKKCCNEIPLSDEDAINLLLSDDYEDKFKVFVKHGFTTNKFKRHVLSKGSLEQITMLGKYICFYGQFANHAKLFEDFGEETLTALFSRYQEVLPYEALLWFIEKNFEKPLVAYFQNSDRLDDLSAALVMELFYSKFEKAKKEYLKRTTKLIRAARQYLYKNGSKEEILSADRENVCIDDLLLLLANEDDDIKKLAIDIFSTNSSTNQSIFDDILREDFSLKVLDLENRELVKHFLKETPVILNDNAEVKLIKRGDEELILEYISKEDTDMISDKANLLIFETCSDEVKKVALSNYGYPYLLERKLILEGKDDEVISYIKDNVLYHMNEVALLSRKNKELAKMYLLYNGFFNKIAETVMMKECMHELVEFYLNLHYSQKQEPKHKLSQSFLYYFILNGKKEYVISYIKKMDGLNNGRLQVAALLRGDMDILTLIKPFFTNAIVSAVRKGDASQLKNIFGKVLFSAEAEIELIKKGNQDILYSYIDVANFSKEAEAFLFEQDMYTMHSVMDYYIEHHSLHEETEMLLINNNQHSLFKLYIEKYAIGKKTEDLMCEKL